MFFNSRNNINGYYKINYNNINSWKNNNLNKNTVVSKYVKNSNSTGSNNFNCIPRECDLKSKYKYKANPIKHYRKQYVNNNLNNRDFIGVFDKPNNYIITNNDISNSGVEYYLYNNINYCKTEKTNTFTNVIKPSTTVIDNNYSVSNKELLYKKCKTFNQNLPKHFNVRDISNGTMKNCDANNCIITFNPSNKKYQVQGPITSSARIIALKYGCSDEKRCFIKETDYNNKKNLNDNKNIGCKGCKDTILRRKRINILS